MVPAVVPATGGGGFTHGLVTSAGESERDLPVVSPRASHSRRLLRRDRPVVLCWNGSVDSRRKTRVQRLARFEPTRRSCRSAEDTSAMLIAYAAAVEFRVVEPSRGCPPCRSSRRLQRLQHASGQHPLPQPGLVFGLTRPFRDRTRARYCIRYSRHVTTSSSIPADAFPPKILRFMKIPIYGSAGVR